MVTFFEFYDVLTFKGYSWDLIIENNSSQEITFDTRNFRIVNYFNLLFQKILKDELLEIFL